MDNDRRLQELIFKRLLRSAYEEMGSSGVELSYQALEYDCKSNLSDEDMILLHIDIALQNGDKEQFITLTNQLKEVVKT